MTCPACDGDLVILGVFGNRVELRCRDCGVDSSVDRDDIGLEVEGL